MEDAVVFFREATGANVAVNWRALEAAGINRTTAIDLDVKDVSATSALRTTLELLGGGTVRVAFRCEDEIINISTAEDLEHKIVRIYDVRDLTPYGTVRHAKSDFRTVDAFVTMLRETTEPMVWDGVSGIHYFAGRVVVLQTSEVHEKVRYVLAELRRAE